MLKNYLIIAWRQIVKNKLYASINILGLMTGLCIYVFGSLLVDYENSHDTFFKNADRIFTVASLFSPNSGVGVTMNDGTYTAFGPLLKADAPQIEALARTVRREFLVSIDDSHYYEQIKFTDPDFLKIFDFEYIEGNEGALADPAGVLLSASMAKKLFGKGPALGQTLELDHESALHVTAVIEDVATNTHFSSSLIQDDPGISMVAPLAALNTAIEYDLEGNWNNLSSGDMTYMLMPQGTSLEQVQRMLNGAYDSHFSEDSKELIIGLSARKLVDANTAIWDMVGMPVLESLQILAILVLIVAIVNYTNLATAQSLSRAREVGLRKTMGASQGQLLAQFLVESICIVAISMLFALAVLELLVPLFNGATGRALQINYWQTLPWLMGTTLLVGAISGAYPAFLITRATPITALRKTGTSRGKGGLFRSTMLGLQFTISIFMLAMVIVVYAQNQKVMDSSTIYPRSQILTLMRLGIDSIQERKETLRNELLQIDGVENVTYSSQVPYEQSSSSTTVATEAGNDENSFSLMQIRIDDRFLATYNIPLLAGRDLEAANSADTLKSEVFAANVLVNELALDRFGFGSPQEALGSVYYDVPDDREPRAYTIVGVLPNQNFQGFHNEIKPMVFYMSEGPYGLASIRIASGTSMQRVLRDVENTWTDVIPEYPIQTRFLDESFEDGFGIFRLTTQVLGGFAVVALLLSTIGLFGLAAFMAQSRTKEIGIRKVMGANITQIVRLLIWQFSRPVLWSLLVALPLAYLSSDMYLNFFADRIAAPAGIVAASGVLAVLFAWGIVAIHAIRVARANPIRALRYE